MEAVPRLPMINFDLLTSPEKVQFGPKIKQYIASFYQEDPESYANEIRTLEGLRASAVWPSIDINNCQIMKKYYCQLCFLKSRFPMEENQVASVYFSWKDDYTKMACSVPDINFELMCILVNIGSIHSKLGAEDARNSPEGMKMSCTHFQCAAWAFQTVREVYGQLVGLIMVSPEQIHAQQLICLAQAQECILEKSLLDNRKATIISKIAIQLVIYYRQAMLAFQSGEETLVMDHLRNHKYLFQYLMFKISYARCISLLYQGQQAEEQQKMGERVAYYQAALDTLEEARKQMQRMPSANQAAFKDTLAFTLDVVEGKRKAATNENEFIYHEDVPEISTLPEIKGASLVKGIPFNIHDTEVSGADIFNRLVPMEAHEASSLYSEQKAEMLRCIGARVEEKDVEINEFMSSLRLDWLSQMKTAHGLTHDIADRAAVMCAKPNATKDLVDAMAKLSNSYQEVEAMLKEIQELLLEEEVAEKEYQKVMGKRPPSIIATDLSREAAKYQEAHGKASDSNQNLHKAMTTHVANIKVLAQPLSQLRIQIPSLNLPDANINSGLLEQLESLVGKIEKMRSQRAQLMGQLRDAIHQDDITQVLVTRQPDQTMEAVFEQELEKHRKTGLLIDQNLLAQHNICKAIVETYAKFTPSRKYIQDFLHKRNSMMAALIASHDTYDDLLGKANKGIEFYAKLETNVAKLLQRIKSACKVQQEEREQIMINNGHGKLDRPEAPSVSEEVNANPGKPKLKDYLDSMKDKKEPVIGPQMQYPTSSMYPNGTTAQWSNSTNVPVNNSAATQRDYMPSQTGYTSNLNTTVNTCNYGSHGYTQVNYSDKNMDQALADRLTSLKIGVTNMPYDAVNSQAYNFPVSVPPAATYTFGPTNLHTVCSPQTNTANYSNPPSAYQTVSSTNYPYITSAEQYVPEIDQKFNSAVGTTNYTYGTASTTTAAPAVTTNTTSYNGNYGKQYTGQAGSYNYNTPNAYDQQGQYAYGQGTDQNQAYGYQYYGSDGTGFNQSNQYVAGTSYSDKASTPAASGSQYGAQPNTAYSTYNQNVYSSQTNTSYPYNQEQNAGYGQYTTNSTAAVTNPQISYAATNPIYTVANPNQIQSTYTSNQSQIPPYTANENQPTYTQNQVQPTYTAANTIQPTYTVANANQIPPTYNVNSNMSYSATSTPNTGGYDQSYASTSNTAQYTQATNLQYPQQNNTYNYETYPTNYYNQYPTNYANTTYNQQSYDQQPTTSTAYVTPDAQNAVKKESSIDLLAGLDFSVSQAPLVPQKESKLDVKGSKPEIKEILPPKKSEDKKPEPVAVKVSKKKDKLLKRGNPFANMDTVKQFVQEVEKFEKYVESLNVKTLSGPSTLDLKWKEIQDCQENVDGAKKSISVARCYPLRNRSPDILPYDYSRVELTTSKDDYVNASHVRDANPFCMDFIVTQSPLQGTISDFWAMVWEQQVETIVCLLSSNELGQEIYWPSEVGREITIGTKGITMLSCTEKDSWIERKLNFADPELKESWIVTVLQFTGWPGSLFPTNPLPFVDFLMRVINIYGQQKCSGDPVLVHCLAGVGRSGICTVLLAVLMELAATACPLPDITGLACKVSCARKNILRDREHLKFVYVALLSYVQTLKRDYTKSDTEKAEEIIPKEKSTVDPLSTLDPLWATRKL